MGKMIRTKTSGIYDRDGGKVLDKWFRGMRIYENLGAISQSYAENVLKTKEAAILEGRYFPKNTSSLKVRDILNYYWGEYLQYLPSSKDAKYLLSAVDSKLGSCTFNNLKRSVIDGYKRKRSAEFKKIYTKKGVKFGKPISKRTVQAELNILNMALNRMADDGEIPFNPVKCFIKVEQDKPKKIVLDDGYENGPEWQAIYQNAQDDKKLIFLCLYYTGMRPKECFHFRYDWIEKITEEFWMIKIPSEVEKTETERLIPVAPILRDSLKLKWMSGLVFPSSVTGDVIKGIHKAFSGAVKRSGLSGKGYTPYVLRRTRLTIWDEIDSDAAKCSGGHTLKGTHYKNYVRFTKQRLFKLVGLEFHPVLKVKAENKAA